MTCPKCRASNREDARFCRECGTTFGLACSSCGAEVDGRSKFCDRCGAPVILASSSVADPARFVSPASYTPKHLAERILTSRSALEGERKQVTVLFADAAGFSTLSERLDPEAVHTIMDGCFDLLLQAVHRYEGTINQFTGDGVMALFGAPVAHEDHAARALQAALAIQMTLKDYDATVRQRWGVPFQMRIGVNTGLVVVGRIGDDLRMDYTAQGDTTNLAARFQQLAPPGSIYVGDATYRIARGGFDWQSLGALTVKGREGSVRAYELVGGQPLRSRFAAQVQRGLTRFVGRTSEFGQLATLWQEARLGHGRVVSIVGEAGLGKSRLVHEFKHWLVSERAVYFEGSCFAYGESISYLPFIEALKSFLTLEGQETEHRIKERLRAALATLGLDVPLVAPYLENLLAVKVEDDVFHKLLPHLIRERTVEALKVFVAALATHEPFVLIIEDVHWIDKATEEVLTSVVEALPSLGLLVVLIYRPEYLHAWASKAYHAQISLSRMAGTTSAEMARAVLSKPYASKLSLSRLSPAESKLLVQDLLQTPHVAADFEELIVTKTEGNPFFVEELTLSMLESGDLVPSADGYALARPVESLRLPATVQGVLLARIDRLDADLKHILQLACVVGRVFAHPVLAACTDGDPSTFLDTALSRLEELELIYRTADTAHREYSFKHVLTQQAVYDSLLLSKRQEYHARIGHVVERLFAERIDEYYELLAYHFSHSAELDDAVGYLVLANRKAARANAVAEAKSYFDQAMQLLDALSASVRNQKRRVELLVDNVMVFQLLFRWREYYDLLKRHEPTASALQITGLLGAFYARLAHCEFAFGRFSEASRMSSMAAPLCEADGDAENAGYAFMLDEWSHLYLGDYDATFRLKRQVLRKMEEAFNLRWYHWAYAAASWANVCIGRWGEALEDAEEELRIAEKFSDQSLISFANWNFCIAYTAKGDIARAMDYGERAVAKAPTPADRAYALGPLAWAWCRHGEPDRAIPKLAEIVGVIREAGWRPSENFSLYLGEAYLVAGELDKAQESLRTTLELAEECGMRFFVGSCHRLLGEVALRGASDRLVAAREHFERSIATLSEINAENELAAAYAGYGEALGRSSRITDARDYFTRAVDIFERLGTLLEPERIRTRLAALPAGDS